MCQQINTYAKVGGVMALAAAVVGIGHWQWNRATDEAVERLESWEEEPVGLITSKNFNDVPEPVSRYLKFALKTGPSRIRTTILHQEGKLRTGGIESCWHPFNATEYISGRRPGFVWDANIVLAPGFALRIRDSYIRGRASAQANMGGTIPILNEHGRRELDAGSLHRYLAEAVWCPTSLFGRKGLSWQGAGGNSAIATLVDGDSTVSLKFEFNSRGEIISAYTPNRYRDIGGRAVPTPWLCRYRAYAEVGGVYVPTEAEVEWFLPEGPLPCWRGNVRQIEHKFEVPAAESLGRIDGKE